MHTSSTLVLVLAVFAASLVEMVEALTIVVAAGVSRGWRSALEGAARPLRSSSACWSSRSACRSSATSPSTRSGWSSAPCSWSSACHGCARPSCRSSGHKALHDEDEIYAETVAELKAEETATPATAGAARRRRLRRRLQRRLPRGHRGGVDRDQPGRGPTPPRAGRLGGGARRSCWWPIVGLVVARQLSEVPENTIKTVVGVMLTSFGVFWVGEGAGVHWPGDDLAIPVLVGFFVVVYFGYTALMRTRFPGHRPSRPRGRGRDGCPRAARCGPSATSGGTSSSATPPNWPWQRASSLPRPFSCRQLDRRCHRPPPPGRGLPPRQHAAADAVAPLEATE